MYSNSFSLAEKETYLGYVIQEVNRVQRSYSRERYMEIINNATTLGLPLHSYLDILDIPCQNCGTSSIVIPRLNNNLNKKFRKKKQINLFIFFNSSELPKTKRTELKLSYSIRTMVNVNASSVVFTHINTTIPEEAEATISVFKDNVLKHTFSCEIKNNIINKLSY